MNNATTIFTQAILFAEVIIPLALPRTYTWAIPDHLAHAIVPGSRVEVGLKQNKKYAGIVRSVHNNAPAYPTKEILNVLDSEPVVYPAQLKLWQWISHYYACTEGDVMQAALPAHLKLSSETVISYNEDHGFEMTLLSNDEYIVAEALDIRKELKLQEVQKLLDDSHVYPVIKKLIEKRICYVWEALSEKYKEKKETYILLAPAYHGEAELEKLVNEWSRAPKQLNLLLAFLHFQKMDGEVTQKKLLEKADASAAQLKGLLEKKVLIAERRAVDRIFSLPKNIKVEFELSAAQEQALAQVREALIEKDTCLLHGVTGSGKTLIYIRLIEEQIKLGKQVLFLLPEIALTTQIIRRLQLHFGGWVAVYHSKFSPNERVELWNKVKAGDVKIVLGARSSLFLPFHDLSLIIADEEHDGSYKQHEPAPRYHARDAAIYYASVIGAKVVLGSATPSVETYYNAVQGKYGFVELKERYGGIELPDIELIDLRKFALKDKSKPIITLPLKEAIDATIARGKQVILFQNRRGYSPYQICAVCGWIPKCEHCDVSLTLHKSSGKLHCHYCGTTYPNVKTCAACGSQDFSQKNFGTEKIEEVLDELLPDAKIARMDIDSVRGKHSHDALINLFEQQRIDILVGTQMVVKGLDFDHVGLVGILDADGILGFADFRVNERAFQLMEQVSGRAGRKGEKGKVLVQVTNTKHPLLAVIQAHDYRQFFDVEIQYRRQYFYPPFSRIIKIQCKHKDKNTAQQAAQFLANKLLGAYDQYLNGPAEPPISRVRNQYIYELMLKLPRQLTLLQQCKQQLQAFVIDLHHEKTFSRVQVIIDVDSI
ncbi:MAG: primosomal protein N' [Chitinophagaceae bacterium]